MVNLPGALAGIRVLDLTRIASGPYATMLLADHGADVVKIEEPSRGDDTRAYPPYVAGESTYNLSLNRGKKSVAVDLNSVQGQEILRSAVAEFDILIHNYRPVYAGRIGLRYEDLAAINPRLIYCTITGFGTSGPKADKPAYDLFVAGIAGLMSVTGEPDGPPQRPGVNLIDHLAGLNAAFGILLALRAREQTGRGQRVEVSLLDSLVSCSGYLVAAEAANGKAPKPTSHNQHAQIVPYGTFRTADGYINLGVLNDKVWSPFCRALSCGDLSEDPRFATNALRVENKSTLLDLIRPILLTRTSAEWLEAFEAAGIPCGPINSFADVLADPQVIHNELLVKMEHPAYGSVTLVRSPVLLSETPASLSLPPPTLGEHPIAALRAPA
ncbi:MAG TPA: CoA transferase [Candidatus Dormibacteraeota bacterium]|nr:CoA transferase [Candidatus Dormibacteraeota bacterium]